MIFDNRWSAGELLDCLQAVPPVELKGMALIRHSGAPASHNADAMSPDAGQGSKDPLWTDVIEAVTEFTHYTNRSCQAAHQLVALDPAPLIGLICAEWAL